MGGIADGAGANEIIGLATVDPGGEIAALSTQNRFRCGAGLATEARSSPLYERDRYWRDPVWAPDVLPACDGLRRMGERALAGSIADDFRRTCDGSGFAENYAADDGAPLRDPAYTWTASVYQVLGRRF